MAAAAENPCCAAWKEKYKKLVEKRNALRQAVDLLKAHSVSLQTSRNEEKAKEEVVRASLENEVSALKSDISSLRQSGADGGGDRFRAEISRLEDLLKKEKARADSAVAERGKAVEALKREADEARSKLESEKEVRVSLSNEVTALKSRVLSLSQNNENGVKHCKKEISELEKVVRKERIRADSAEAEKKKVAEELKKEVDELRSKLVLESRKLEEANRANRKLEAQLQKGAGEKKRSDAERVKAEEHRKVAELNRKKAEEEKHRADQLLMELGKCRQEVEELRKQKKALLSAKKVTESSVVMPCKEIKLLKKQLKFEKMRVKHAKEVAKLERSRNGMVQQELAQLKSEFVLFSQRLNALGHCFSPSTKDVDEQLEKGRNLVAMRKAERELFESFANNSREANFSNGQLASSQEIGALSGTTWAKNSDGNLSIEPTTSSLSGQDAQERGNVNLAVVAENSVRSSLKVDVASGAVHGHDRKRKRTRDAGESIENLYSRSKKCHMQIEEKLSVLHGMVNGKTDAVKEGKCDAPQPQCDTRTKRARLEKKKKVPTATLR